MRETFVTLREGARRLGISEPALRRRIAAGDLTSYVNPLDHRTRLVAVDALDAYGVPRPIDLRRQTEEVSA